MDPSSEAQTRIERRRLELASRYPQIWSEMISAWHSPGPGDRAWLVYAANYMFRTGGVRWAIDPLSLCRRVAQAPRVDAGHDLAPLAFVLLTHEHADHLDLELISALRAHSIRWVVPEALLPRVVGEAGLPQENILIPRPGQPMHIAGHMILPFEGLHLEPVPGGCARGVPALGYLVENGGRRWLFPGDTRRYDAARLPAFGPVDALFAHLWLGRASALLPHPPLLEAFCRFCIALQPRRLIVTHLEELGRDAADAWDARHFEQVRARLEAMAPGLPVEAACTGDAIAL